MASSMAFFWADEPSPFSVPEAQAASPPDVLPDDESSLLLSEPHAVRAMAPTSATAARRACEVSFTGFPFVRWRFPPPFGDRTAQPPGRASARRVARDGR